MAAPGSVARMAERRKLTADELAAADALKAAIADARLSYESVAGSLGVTAAAVGHWAGGSIVVPLDRVGRLASIIGADPSSISVRWREQVAPFLRHELSGVAGASQPARYDPDILADAMTLLDDLDKIQGRKPAERPNPARLAIACEVIAGGGMEDGRSVVVRLADRFRQQGQGNGNDAGSDSGVGTADGGSAGAAAEAKPSRRRA